MPSGGARVRIRDPHRHGREAAELIPERRVESEARCNRVELGTARRARTDQREREAVPRRREASIRTDALPEVP